MFILTRAGVHPQLEKHPPQAEEPCSPDLRNADQTFVVSMKEISCFFYRCKQKKVKRQNPNYKLVLDLYWGYVSSYTVA